MNKKCSQCLKLISEDEADACDKCDQDFCLECLAYQGTSEELAFCRRCNYE
jgi:hypothetical protein